ncbi:hypothetical protein BDW75DRAFT_234347 [Aspergillus navahoensis]
MAPYMGELLSDSVAEHIGCTPLVRLRRLPASLNIKAKICAKLEFFYAGGSVKDRIAKRMLEQAEQDGLIKPGDTLIEASSGNTGIAIALMAAVKGYNCIIVLSEKMSLEKEQILHALGASVVRTPAGVPIESDDSILSVARRLNKETPNSWILDQYNNPENHEPTNTGQQTNSGTGGTITGLSRGLKKKGRSVFVVGVDPIGSVLAHPACLNEQKSEYKVEGIGYDFVPGVLDQTAPDAWVKTKGILCGGSSGAVSAGLLNYLSTHPEDNVENKAIVLIFPDGLRNYLTKFGDDSWMESNGFTGEAY